MFADCIDKREYCEMSLLCLVIDRPSIIELMQIKPTYLRDERFSLLLGQMIECYKKYKVVDIARMFEMNNDKFNIELYLDLFDNSFHNRSNWQDHLNNAEDMILTFYKQDVIKDLNNKLESGVTTYDKFVDNIKKISEIKLTNKIEKLTIHEILDNINVSNSRINIKNFDRLNDTLKLVQGDFLIVGASTGVGKSALLLNLYNGLIDDYQCIYFNMEMSKSTIYKRLVAIRSNVPMYSIDSPNQHQSNLINEAIEQLTSKDAVVEHKANDIYKIKSIVGKIKNKDRHTILFIDHLGLTRCEDKKSLYEQITEVAKQLRQICLEYDCTIIAASQLSRAAYNSEEITLNMLKDSGELENSSSKTILLYRDKNESKEVLEPTMFVDIAKNRDGLTGIIKMKYDKTKQTFKELMTNE